jgi:YHS domain-containing protein
MLVACLGGAIALAEDKKDPPTTQPVNKMCAVDQDHKADPKVTTTYKDKTIAFCCEDCIPAFKKDPEKYMKDLK